MGGAADRGFRLCAVVEGEVLGELEDRDADDTRTRKLGPDGDFDLLRHVAQVGLAFGLLQEREIEVGPLDLHLPHQHRLPVLAHQAQIEQLRLIQDHVGRHR